MQKRVWTSLHAMLLVSVLASAAYAQPVQYTEIPPNSTNFTAIGNLVYFTIDDQLWRTDGTAEGTFFLKEGLDVRSLPFFSEFGGMVFFPMGEQPDAGDVAWKELWRTDGTVAGTILLKSSSDYNIVISDTTSQYVFFGASDSDTGYELYRTNGTVEATSLVRDINPGTASGFHGSAAAVSDELFFAGDDGVHGTELWKSNGISSGTTMVKDIFAGSGNGFATVPYSWPKDESYFGTNTKFFFTGYTPATGNEPWTSDGSEAGTFMLGDLTPDSEGTAYIFYKIAHNGNLYFITKPPQDTWDLEESRGSLWKTQGSAESTVKLRDVGDPWHVFEDPFRILGNRILFFSRDTDPPDGPHSLWATDGTSDGTQRIFFVGDQVAVRLPFEDVVNDHLLFYVIQDGAPSSFFRSDGTSTGTETSVRFASGAYLKYPRDVTKVGDLVFYGDHDGPAYGGNAENPEDYFQLMQYDGFTAQSVRDIEGGSYSGTFDIVDFNGKVVFTTYDENAQSSPTIKKLWIYDPNTQPSAYFTLVDADSDEDIQRLHEGDTIATSADRNINITYTPAEPVGSVVFKHQDKIVRTENAAPYALAGDNNGNYLVWTGAAVGPHKVEAIPYSGAKATGTAGPSLAINFTISEEATSPCPSNGSILREYWDNVEGNKVSDIPITEPPTSTNQLTLFEEPTNFDTNYGTRIRGYLCPPVTGNYTFWIASNDQSELWLSTDDNPANKKRIAYVTGATDPRQWDKYATQKSAVISLMTGQRYYIEALHKQGVGTDNLAVGWQLPGGTMERPVLGNRLSPFAGQLMPKVTIVTPADGESFVAPAKIEIKASIAEIKGERPAVQLYAGSRLLNTGDAEQGVYSFVWSNVAVGSYPLTVVAREYTGVTATSPVVNIVVNAPCSATGTIKREYWTGVEGNRVSDIPVSEPPSGVMELPLFESANSGTNYGARISGFICPPSTGEYVFWIASNDHSELWLSDDDQPANKKLIAFVTGATNPRQWDKFSSQRSVAVPLVQGKKYYVEALHKQGVGTDHVSVGWQLPDGTMERPIGGNRLSPYEPGEQARAYVMYPADGVTNIDPLVVKLKIQTIPGPSLYTIEVNTQPDFTGDGQIVNSVEEFQNTYILKDLQPSTTYYTRVTGVGTSYGPVTHFTTRDAIPRLRLWGLTTSGGLGYGTIFSYSIDDQAFQKHYDNELYSYTVDGTYYEYDQTLHGTLVSGPEGIFYGHAEHPYANRIFTLSANGQVKWWPDEVFMSNASLMLGSDNYLYSANDDFLVGSVIDKFDTESNYHTRIREFDDTRYGNNAGSPLVELTDGYLYGAAGEGGINGGGVLFKMQHDGSDFQLIHDFDNTTGGMNPYSGLTQADSFLYGTTVHGGDGGNNGTVYKLTADGAEFTKLHDFYGADGSNPYGEVLIIANVLYGMTTNGGSADAGVIYRINKDGSGFAVLHQFSGSDGARPSGALVSDRAGNLYGMTSIGGLNNLGVLFKVATDGSGFVKLFDFTSESGGNPNGSLVIREDTYVPATAVASSVEMEQSATTLAIHPNPSTDEFTVESSSLTAEPTKVVVMDQYGMFVSSYEISAGVPVKIGSDWRRGIYFLRVTQGEYVKVQRLVKK